MGQAPPLPVRSQVTLAVLVLGLGAGLSNADLRHVRGTDVRRDPSTGAVLVHVGGPRTRTVPLLARYEAEALRLAAEAGDGWILNPGLDPAAGTGPEAVVNSQIKAAKPPTSAPKLKITRCLTT